jgi:LuxR family maltose regulon positive regulatory protein
MLKLAWLGPPVAELDGVQVHFETRKIAALLAYLSLNPQGCSREKLAALFWPEFDQTHAMANLRRALGSLTRALHPDYFETNRESVRWSENSQVELDVLEFQDLIQAVRAHEHESGHDNRDQGLSVCQACLERLETTCEVYRGDFLDGLNLPDAPAFDDWQYLTRAELNRELAWALEHWTGALASQAAAGQLAPGQPAWEKAAAVARRWLSLDRLEASAYLALVEIYTRAGQRTLAQRQIDEYTRLYKEEFGQEPDQEIRASFQNALSQGQPHRREAKTAPSPSLDNSQVLLKTKLYLPRVKSSRVSRQRLITKLNRIAEYKLTLVSAPAGFGKTSLLVDWSAQTDLLVGWLSLDSEDNDPNRFLSYLCAALDNMQEGLVNTAKALLDSVQLVSPQTVITVLLKDIEAAAEPLVLVLDDYQFVTAQSIHDCITYFLERATLNLHLVIASRVDPPLPLARLRVEDDLLELRTDDLRFTLDESADFFSQVMRLEVSPEDIQSLVARTEGWVVGLQMAAISLKGAPDREQFIRTFSGSHRYILEYLIQEVLDRQPESVRDFLLKTSILDRLCSDLCEAVVGPGPEPAYSILDYLEHSNLFLIPLDQECHWYRYHQLFADLLRVRLQQYEPRLVAELHQRAADWYAQNSYSLEAVRHALQSGDYSFAADLLEEYSLEMMWMNQIVTTIDWFKSLPPEVVESRPFLVIYQAFLLARKGEFERVEGMLVDAETSLKTMPVSAKIDDYRILIFGMRAFLANLRGDSQKAIQHSLNISPAARDQHPTSYIMTRTQLAVAYLDLGDLCTAEKVFTDVALKAQESQDVYYAVLTNKELAELWHLRGRPSQAAQLYKQMDGWIRQTVHEPELYNGLIKVYQAGLLIEKNELEAARLLLQEDLESLLSVWRTTSLYIGYMVMAYLLTALREFKGAGIAVGKALNWVTSRSYYPRNRSAVQACQVNLWLAEGSLAEAQDWAQSNFPQIPNDLPFIRELDHLCLSRILVASRRWEEASDLLQRLSFEAQAGKRFGRLLKINILRALALQELGKQGQALAVLEKSLVLAEPEGYIRIFLDEGQPVQQLLAKGIDQVSPGPLRDYITHLLFQFDAKVQAPLTT